MEKRISRKELAAVKRTAMNVAPIVAKKNKAKAMIEKWTKEYDAQEAALVGYESGLMAQLGLRTEQVVTKVVEPTGKFDDNGKEKKQTKYVLNPNVHFDQDTNEYVVTIETEPCSCENNVQEECIEHPVGIAEENTEEPEVEVQEEVAEAPAEPQESFQEQFGF